MGRYIIRPASDASVAWTPNSGSNNFDRVKETLKDDETTYNHTSTLDNEDLFLGQDSGIPIGSTITGVKVHTWMEKIGAPAVSAALIYDRGGDTGQQGDFSTTESYVQYTYDIFALETWSYLDFDGSADSIKWGYKHRQSQTRELRATMTWVEVTYDPPTPTKSPDVVVDDATVGTASWTTPENVKVLDAANATVILNSTTSHYLKTTDYKFTIPAGATINGIEVRATRSKNSTSNTAIDNSIKLVKGGTISGDDKSTGARWNFDEGDEAVNPPSFLSRHGGAADLWGQTWSVSDINDSGFGVAFSGSTTGGVVNLFVNHISITVYFTPSDNGQIIKQVMVVT